MVNKVIETTLIATLLFVVAFTFITVVQDSHNASVGIAKTMTQTK